MVGSMVDYAVVGKKIKHATPAPNKLISSSSFVIDFDARKFLNIGLDPADDFNVAVHIITMKHFISVSSELFVRIFPLMNDIISFLSEKPVKCRHAFFMTTACTSISCMVHRGKSVLSIESTVHEGQRVMLDRDDLVVLKRLERSISETIIRNVEVIKPEVIDQFDRLVASIDDRFSRIDLSPPPPPLSSSSSSSSSSLPPPNNPGAMISFIENLADERVRPISISVRCGIDFTVPLQIYAAEQLAKQWDLLRRRRSSSIRASTKRCDECNGDRISLARASLAIDVNNSEEPHTPHLTGYAAMIPPPPPPPTPPSPPSVPCYSPSMGSSDYLHESATLDVNDGPDFFARHQPISSVMDFDTAVSEMFWIPK
ncbi:uncharacterized protein LOC112681349 [Sipha flava]|uniref:Uncharacterized protein LOC112681349 n=1 Tax=Sipha flava TaxID=143950 RepID=A0A8B8F980_9HEMI|nr:uncharacterized protein LOC112681349 [Sipha flava]